MKKRNRKLNLNKETILHLDADSLRAHGGVSVDGDTCGPVGSRYCTIAGSSCEASFCTLCGDVLKTQPV